MGTERTLIRVAALTSGRLVPSARFRVRQHIEPLRAIGIDVREYVPSIDKYQALPGWPKGVSLKFGLPYYALWQGLKLAARLPGLIGSWRSDATWLERELLPGYLTLEPLLGHPLILDVDDAIWLRRPPFGETALKAMAKRADVVIAGNSYLAQWLAHYARDVRIVPTAVDTDRFKPLPVAGGRDRKAAFVMGWIGSSWNLRYLQAIEAPLRQFLEAHREAELLVVSDQPPDLYELPASQIRHVPWSIDSEVETLQQMDVGLMPMPDDEWTRGKCSFKMLQYMACEVPTIVSPVGMNIEVLAMGQGGMAAASHADWYEALEFLYEGEEQSKIYGRAGRATVQRYYSREVVSRQLGEIIGELSSG